MSCFLPRYDSVSFCDCHSVLVIDCHCRSTPVSSRYMLPLAFVTAIQLLFSTATTNHFTCHRAISLQFYLRPLLCSRSLCDKDLLITLRVCFWCILIRNFVYIRSGKVGNFTFCLVDTVIFPIFFYVRYFDCKFGQRFVVLICTFYC